MITSAHTPATPYVWRDTFWSPIGRWFPPSPSSFPVMVAIRHHLNLLSHPRYCKNKNKNTLGSVPIRPKLSQKALRQLYKKFSSIFSSVKREKESRCLRRVCFVHCSLYRAHVNWTNAIKTGPCPRKAHSLQRKCNKTANVTLRAAVHE
jgi:hypothetical protein